MKIKFIEPQWCAEGYSNNWRKVHHYPMRRKYKKHHTYPCSELKKNGLCGLQITERESCLSLDCADESVICT